MSAVCGRELWSGLSIGRHAGERLGETASSEPTFFLFLLKWIGMIAMDRNINCGQKYPPSVSTYECKDEL